MCVIDKTVYKDDGTRCATFETHWAAVRSILKDYDKDGNYLDVPREPEDEHNLSGTRTVEETRGDVQEVG